MDVSAIAALYHRARGSHLESVSCLLECGTQLQQAKDAIPYGEWLLWLKEHETALGFGVWTAQRLLRLARETWLATHLTDEDALKVSRQIWGHEPAVESTPAIPTLGYLHRMFDWASKHEVQQFVILPGEVAQLEAGIHAMRQWLSALERALPESLKACA